MVSEKELEILHELRINSRVQLAKISRKTGIPISSIFDTLKCLNKEVINRNVSLLNFDKLGFNTQTIITLKVNSEERPKICSFLMAHPNVNNLFKINNGFDFMLEAIFKSLQDFEEFQEELTEKYTIKSFNVYYILSDLKREYFLTDNAHIKLVN